MASQHEVILTAMRTRLEALSFAPTVYQGRRWPHNWDAPFAVLLVFRGIEPGEGHGGWERRTYVVDVVLRYRVQDSRGESQQDGMLDRATAVRDAFHLRDSTDFSFVPTGFHQVEAADPFEVTDRPDGSDKAFIEVVVPVSWHVFEAI